VYFQRLLQSKFWSKVFYIEDVYDIYNYLNRDQVHFPEIVYKCSRIFGTPLEEVLSRPDHVQMAVPIVIEQTVQYLIENKATKIPGIFRFNGEKNDVQKLKEKYDKGEPVQLEKIKDAHTVAGLVKLYLSELPESVFPVATYDLVLKSHPSKDRLGDIETIIKGMFPTRNKCLLSYLLGVISAVQLNASENNMGASALAIVFAPLLIRPPKEKLLSAERDAPQINSIMKTIIENHEKLLPLLDQKVK